MEEERRRRIWGPLSAALGLLFIILLLLLPTLASTEWGKGIVLRAANKSLGGTLSVRSLSLSWFGSQDLEEIRFSDAHGDYLCKSITSDAPLWRMLLGKHDLGQMVVDSLQVKLSTQIKQETASTSSPSKSEPKKTESKELSLPFMGHITLQNGLVEITTAGLDPLLFHEIQVDIDIPDEGAPMSLSMMGKTKQKQDQGKFNIRSMADRSNPKDPSFEVQAQLIDLPVIGVDQLVSIFEPKARGLILAAIGPSLNLDLEVKASGHNLEMILNGSSSNFFTQMQTTSKKEVITLLKPAELSLTITPSFAKQLLSQFPEFKEFSLQKEAHLDLKMTEFSLPRTEQGLQFAALGFQAQVDLTQAAVSPSMTLSEFKASLNSKNLQENLSLQIHATAKEKTETGSLHIEADLGGIGKELLTGSVQAQGQQIPLKWLENNLPLLVGPSLNFNLSAILGKEMRLSASSSQFKMTDAKFTLGQQIALTAPVVISLTPPCDFLKAVAPEHAFLFSTNPIKLSVSSLTISPSQPELMKMKANLNIPSLLIDKRIPLNDFNADIEITSWENISLQIKEKSLQLKTQLGLKKDLLVIQKPVLLSYLMDQEQFQVLFPDSAKDAVLLSPATLQCTLEPLSFPFKKSSFSTLTAKGSASIDALRLATKDRKKQVSLENVNTQFQMQAKAGSAFVNFSAEVKDPAQKPGILTGQLSMEHLNFDTTCTTCKAIVDARVELKELSTFFLETWFGQPLTPLIGSTCNLEFKVHSSIDSQTLSLKALSEHVQADVALVAQDGKLKLQHGIQGAKIELSMTPEGYEVLDQLLTLKFKTPSPFQLGKTSSFTLSLNELSLPIFQAQKGPSVWDRIPELQKDFTPIVLEGALEIDQFALLDKKSSQLVTLRDFHVKLDKTSTQGPLTFNLNGSVVTNGQSSKEKQLSIQGKIDQITSNQGKLDFKTLSTSLSIQAQQFPVIFLDVFARMGGMIDCPPSCFIGPTLNATAEVELQNWNGQVKLNMHAQNSRFSLVGKLHDGILTISEPIYAQMTVTPQLSTLILKDVNPLSLSAVSAKTPISLEIDAKDFSFPVYPFDISKVTIPNATLELGQITCQNEGNINLALSLLKATKFSKEKALKLWFTPMALHIQKGVLNCERTEILVADTFEIATWGDIDFVKEDVDMVLGLTAQCLKKAFGIKNLPQDYVLQIPMKGKLDNVKINTTAATAKIAVLIAWQKKSALGGGGLPGALLGEFLGTLGALPDKDTSYPPAKRPFPWDDGKAKANKKETSHASEKKRAINKKDKPLKQLMKILR